MKKTDWSGIIGVSIGWTYLVGVTLATAYLEYQYAQEHGFVATLFVGPFVSFFKALFWPVYVLAALFG